MRGNALLVRAALFPVVAACGRADLAAVSGSAGGSCYPNGTCNTGLVCTDSLICAEVGELSCAGVTCSGHGTCANQDGVPVCLCETGYQALGLHCLAGSGACPPDMVRFDYGAEVLCIDRYEATVFADPGCQGTRYGRDDDDYAAGFPDKVNINCSTACCSTDVTSQTTPLYACSVVGLVPSRFITWHQARTACQNVGKTLCEPPEWQAACSGADGRLYPYGDVYDGTACNTVESLPDAVVLTGAFANCATASGIYDLSGNLGEWVAGCVGPQGADGAMGGTYTTDSAYDCTRRSDLFSRDFFADLGFRCCLVAGPL